MLVRPFLPSKNPQTVVSNRRHGPPSHLLHRAEWALWIRTKSEQKDEINPELVVCAGGKYSPSGLAGQHHWLAPQDFAVFASCDRSSKSSVSMAQNGTQRRVVTPKAGTSLPVTCAAKCPIDVSPPRYREGDLTRDWQFVVMSVVYLLLMVWVIIGY